MPKHAPTIRPEDDGSSFAWHAGDVAEVFNRLGATDLGLSAQQAQARLDRFGPNMLAEVKRAGPFKRFLSQFNNVLIYVLLASGATTAAMGHWIDTSVIIGVVVINAIIGFVQEGKAEDALQAIRKMLSPQA